MPPTPQTAQPKRRRTQAQRTARTRGLLLDATISCLIENGYAGTTTTAVCKRAGVSHGSLLHHFRKREALLAAALDEVYGQLRARVVAGLEALPEGDARVEAMVDVMWSAFGAREFKAVLELWLAAANHPDAAYALWSKARAFDAGNAPLAERLFPEFAATVPDFRIYMHLLVQTLQGMGLANATLPPDTEGAAMRQQVRALLTRILRDAFACDAKGDA